MMQANLFGDPPLRPEASQWHTPPALARRLAAWVPRGSRCLEPAAGAGNLIAALLEQGHDPSLIMGVELDPSWAEHCRQRFEGRVEIICANFHNPELHFAPYDCILGNFPFEDNEHMHFTLRALDIAPIVVGIFPASFEFSDERDRMLWIPRARVVRRARLPQRVQYGGDSSPKFDSIALRIARRSQPRPEIGSEVVIEDVWRLS